MLLCYLIAISFFSVVGADLFSICQEYCASQNGHASYDNCSPWKSCYLPSNKTCYNLCVHNCVSVYDGACMTGNNFRCCLAMTPTKVPEFRITGCNKLHNNLKYHIGLLVLSVLVVIVLFWALIATVYNFTGNKHTEHVVIEPRSKSATFKNAAAVADSGFCAEIARFGSKMLSKYGFIYNNQMDDFSTPGFRNHWGFEPTAANFIQPGRRPMSSMSPTIVFDPVSGDVKMVTGGTGGSKIISAVAQTLVRGLLLRQTAAEIVEMPRVHNQLTPFETQVEEDFSEKILKQLEKDHDQKMEKTDESLAIVYPITRDGDEYNVAADYRRKSGNAPAGY